MNTGATSEEGHNERRQHSHHRPNFLILAASTRLTTSTAEAASASQI
jgi:hypothetical protein